MGTVKILFSDLDDTLLDNDKNVGGEDLEAINRMINAGHRFVIATGRPVYSAKVVARQLDLYRDGIFLICSNGGVIYDCGSEKTIHSFTVDPQLAGRMFAAASSEGIHIHTYSDTHVLSLRETQELKIYCEKIKMPYKIVEHIPEDLPAPPPKFCLMSIKEGSRGILERFKRKYADLTAGKLDSVFSNDYLLEYLPAGTSKGNAVKKLCHLLDIPIKDSIAVGDEANDVSMIDAAGCGIVVQNGTDAVKSHADYVTERTNNENAIAEIVEKFIL